MFPCPLYLNEVVTVIYFSHISKIPTFLAGHTQAIDSFVLESMETLSTRPESMEEIGAANNKYNQILARKSEVRRSLSSTLSKVYGVD